MMCGDKKSYRDVKELIDKMNQRERDMITPPRSAYDLLMEKQKRLKKCDETLWFIEEHCDLCEAPVFTNGKLYWCKEGCGNNGKRMKR